LNIETSPSSPDFSPASASSALLTPTDLSPARPFDVKLHSPYDHLAPGHAYLSQSSLLSENNSPIKSQEALTSNPMISRSPLVQLNHSRHHVPTGNFPFFDSFSEAPPPATATLFQLNPASYSHASQALYNTVPQRRMDSRLPNVDWRMNSLLQQHQVHTPVLKVNPDWRIPNEKVVSDYSPTAVGGHSNEEPLRGSFVYQQPPGAQSLQTTHEVRVFHRKTPFYANICAWKFPLAY
jgi:pumilio RNA-binding family